jgi:hypothetical protein
MVSLTQVSTPKKELPIGNRNKADILDLLRKNHIPKFYAAFWVPISFNIITFKVLLVIYLFCFFLNYDNNVIINVWQPTL